MKYNGSRASDFCQGVQKRKNGQQITEIRLNFRIIWSNIHVNPEKDLFKTFEGLFF